MASKNRGERAMREAFNLLRGLEDRYAEEREPELYESAFPGLQRAGEQLDVGLEGLERGLGGIEQTSRRAGRWSKRMYQLGRPARESLMKLLNDSLQGGDMLSS